MNVVSPAIKSKPAPFQWDDAFLLDDPRYMAVVRAFFDRIASTQEAA